MGLIDQVSIDALTTVFYYRFNEWASDLYPETDYNWAYCRHLAETAKRIGQLARQHNLVVSAHYYQRPEIQEVAREFGFVGDSLGIALKARDLLISGQQVNGVWLCAVRFMGDTMKIVLGDQVPVFMPRHAGCSLVAAIHGKRFDYKKDHADLVSLELLQTVSDHPVDRWLRINPDGIVLCYMNSDPYSKARAWSVYTSRNAFNITEMAMRENPGRRVLIMPDQYLANLVLRQARVTSNPFINPTLVDVFAGGCHVHMQKISPLALDEAMAKHPNAELLIHPECGCAVDCYIRAQSGDLGCKTHIASTEGMITAARASSAQEFIVATETGHIYTLRSQVPEKKFYPVTALASCEFMKATTLESLLAAMKGVIDSRDRSFEVHLPDSIIENARAPIERMLSVQ